MGRWLALTCTLVFLGALFGCGQGFQAKSNIQNIWLPWPTAGFSLVKQSVRIEGLSDPRQVSGSAAKVYFESGGRLGFTGSVARPRLSRRGELWLPQDVPSSEALTAYAVFANLKKFDSRLGIENRLSWPRLVGFQIRVRTRKGRIFSNALYDAESDSVVLAKLNSDFDPLVLNHGILAHEHFHAHFTKILNDLGKGPHLENNFSKTNAFILSAVNEGLADFYGAVFSGDAAFAKRSFAREGMARDLSGAILTLREAENAEGDDAHYILGTYYARSLYNWGAELGGDGRLQVLKETIRVLPLVIRDLVQTAENRPLDGSDFLQVLMEHQTLRAPAARP